MTGTAPLYDGLLVGLSIAVPIGPMSLLCIQRTLASGMRVGLSTGVGAATVNVVYGAAVLFGLGSLAPWMEGGSRLLGAAGGAYLLWSAARMLLQRRTAPRADQSTPSPLGAYGSAIAFNATNPMSLVLIVALLAPIASLSTPTPASGAALLLGMFAAASLWWLCLTAGVAVLRARLSQTVMLYVNAAAAMLLTLYGAIALARSAGL